MRKKVTLITGASGEIGHELVTSLAEKGVSLLTLDLHELPEDVQPLAEHIKGSIIDENVLSHIVSEYEVDTIYHLAALLSTRAEFVPEQAHKVNVDGTLGLLQLAARQSQWRQEPVKFIFPSSIAVYGLPDLVTKERDGWVRERDWNYPQTMYGCNKLYCEQLGRYYSRAYKQLAKEKPVMLDFRSLRFPGLISAFTLPSGGTSDYGPEMIHAAAKGEPYACFVREDAIIPFMAMPDAVHSLLTLAEAPIENLSQTVYNVTSFSLTAGEIRDWVLKSFPEAEIGFEPHEKRQAIVDSWPAGLDDSKAQRDWGWKPKYDLERAFSEYLIPNIAKRYDS
ncbi:MAG TPA: NAD-dependent epimerase/dehydratase family protein [Anaerolineae bacterium]|nr:NAD-dependent epimerase/dehydratase family protein [Anaerolineae bacterium]